MAIAEKPLGIDSSIAKAKTEPKTPVKNFFDFLGSNPLTRTIVRKIGPFLIDTGTEAVNFNIQALDQIRGYWKPNSLLLIAFAHQSHGDEVVILKITQEVRDRIPEVENFYIPISLTLQNGVQSGISQTFYSEIAVPYFKENGINPVYVITANDRSKRGVVQTREEALQEVANIEEPVKENNSAYSVLPESTVEPGRHNKDGTIKGMVKVTSPFFRIVIEAAREEKREVICVPVGINGTYRLLSGEHIFLTRDSFMAILRRIFRKKAMILSEVTVGSPFIIDPQVNVRELNDLIMGNHIAPLQPEEAQGYYRNRKEDKKAISV